MLSYKPVLGLQQREVESERRHIGLAHVEQIVERSLRIVVWLVCVVWC